MVVENAHKHGGDMPGDAHADRIIRVCVLINAAVGVGALLNAVRTGHLNAAVIVWSTASLAAALVYIRNRNQ
jgi:hypothetical protein